MSGKNPNAFFGDLFSRHKSPFFEVYVQEVLIDPSNYNFPTDDNTSPPGDPFLLITDTIDESELVDAPYNSIIGRVLTDDDHTSEIVVYPMMPGHMSLPLKAGEHVWAMYNNGRYYWLCRKNFDKQVNDLNLAWAGRYKLDTTGRRTSEKTESAESGEGNILPSNRNPKINTIFPQVAENPDDIDMRTYWSERSKSTIEPVPRYKKRPGDLVLQGSNNTLICLGLGGGHKKEDEIQDGSSIKSISSVMPDISDGINRGTIDIVTGRGRYQPSSATNSSSLGDLPERTSCPTITSEFDYKENDKNTTINDDSYEKNPIEGDPDYGFDASRIYVSSHSETDTDFSLIPNYPKIPAVLSTDVGSIPEAKIGANIVLKSDHLRIVARQHVADSFFTSSNAEDVNGSIRIVKEGTRDDDGHSTTDESGASIIALESDGTVMIDGAMIVIGTGREESNGAGNHVYIGAGATEPLVLGNQMKQLLSDFFTELKNWLSTKFDTHIHPTGTGPSGPPTVTGNDAGSAAAKDALDSTLSLIGMTK